MATLTTWTHVTTSHLENENISESKGFRIIINTGILLANDSRVKKIFQRIDELQDSLEEVDESTALEKVVDAVEKLELKSLKITYKRAVKKENIAPPFIFKMNKSEENSGLIELKVLANDTKIPVEIHEVEICVRRRFF